MRQINLRTTTLIFALGIAAGVFLASTTAVAEDTAPPDPSIEMITAQQLEERAPDITAIVVLKTCTLEDLQSAKREIARKGIRVTNVFPPNVLWIRINMDEADTIKAVLEEEDFVEKVSSGELAPSGLTFSGERTQTAISAFNRVLERKAERAAEEFHEPMPLEGDVMIYPDLPSTTEELDEIARDYEEYWERNGERITQVYLDRFGFVSEQPQYMPPPAEPPTESLYTELEGDSEPADSQETDAAESLTGTPPPPSPWLSSFWDTSRYMAGDITVGIFFRPGSEGDWTSGEVDETYAAIVEALDQFAIDEPNANITFFYVNEGTILIPPSSDSNRRIYVKNLMNSLCAQWGFMLIVYNGSGNAVVPLCGPYAEIYKNDLQDGYVVRHVACHIFGAQDQFHPPAAQSPADRWSYLNTVNANSEYDDGLGYFGGAGEGKADIMVSGWGIDNHIGVYTRGQLGWRDSDGDGISDPLDTYPDTILNAPAGDYKLEFTGRASDKAVINEYEDPLIPFGSVTLNVIEKVEYRINGLTWLEASPVDSAFNEESEDFSFTAPALPDGRYLIEARATNSQGNAEVSYVKYEVEIEGSPVVKVAPFAGFTVTPPEGSVDSTFILDASDSSDLESDVSALAVRWDFEDDGIWDTDWSIDKTETVKYSTPGMKTVKLQILQVKDSEGEWISDGLTSSITREVNVTSHNSKPHASFVVTPESEHGIIGEHFTVRVDATGSWDVEDPNSLLFIQWDWEDDGTWDNLWYGRNDEYTEYSNNDFEATHDYLLKTTAAPEFIAKYKKPVPSWKYPPAISDIFVSGNYAYLRFEKQTFQIMDISDPHHPAPKGGYITDVRAHNMFVSGDCAYIPCSYREPNDSYLEILNVSNPDDPVSAAKWENEDGVSLLRDVYVSGDYAYVAAGAGGLKIIDVSDPTSPTLAADCVTAVAYRVFVEGDCAYLLTTAGLQIVDILDPLNPVERGTSPYKGNALFVSGGYAYVTSDFWMAIVDISDPDNPACAGVYRNRHAAGSAGCGLNDVYVKGHHAYVSNAGGYCGQEFSGVQIVDVSEPSRPIRVGLCQSEGFIIETTSVVFISEGYAYVGTCDSNGMDFQGLSIFDISHFGAVPQSRHWRIRMRVTDRELNISEATRDVWCVNYNHPPVIDNIDLSPAAFGSVLCNASSYSDPDFTETWDGLLEFRWDFDTDGVWDTEFESSSAAWFDMPSGEDKSTVTCQIRDRFGATDTVNGVITTLPVLADFNAAPAIGKAPLEVQFVDESVGDILSWLWDFGDPDSDELNASTEENPTHIYEIPGWYTVSLTVTGPAGIHTETKENYICIASPQSPIAAFQIYPYTEDTRDWLKKRMLTFSLGGGASLRGTPSYRVMFEDYSIGDVTDWFWDFGDGYTSTEQNPRHTYHRIGTYTVSLTVTGPDGSDTVVRTCITIESGNGKPFFIKPTMREYTAYVGYEFNLDIVAIDPEGDPISFSFSSFPDPDEFSGAELVDHGDGTATFKWTPTGIGWYHSLYISASGSHITIDWIHVIEPQAPRTDFTASPIEGEAPLEVSFTGHESRGPITEWEWDFGDPDSDELNTSTERNPTHIYDAPGTYTAKLTVSNLAGSHGVEKLITVSYSQPVADFEAMPTFGATPLDVNFIDLSHQHAGTITDWLWEFGDGEISFEQNPGHIYEAPGWYTVSLSVIAEGGTSTETKIAYIVVPPTITITAPLDSAGVSTDSVLVKGTVSTDATVDVMVEGYTGWMSATVIDNTFLYTVDIPTCGTVATIVARATDELGNFSTDSVRVIFGYMRLIRLPYYYESEPLPGEDQPLSSIAVAKDMLDLMRPGIPLFEDSTFPGDTEIHEYAYPFNFAENDTLVELDPQAIKAVLGHFDTYDTNGDPTGFGDSSLGYNFKILDMEHTGAGFAEYVKEIVHWMSWPVLKDSSMPPPIPGGAEPEDPVSVYPEYFVEEPYVPVALPLYADTEGYTRWIVANGCTANMDPFKEKTQPWNFPNDINDITVYGLFLTDPAISGIGRDCYVVASELCNYLKPLPTTAIEGKYGQTGYGETGYGLESVDEVDEYAGRYVMVAEPPEEELDIEVLVAPPRINRSTNRLAALAKSNNGAAECESEGRSNTLLTVNLDKTEPVTSFSEEPECERMSSLAVAEDDPFDISWRDILDPVLLLNEGFKDAIKNSVAKEFIKVHRLDTGEDYYIIPLQRDIEGEHLSNAALIVDAKDGHLLQASCVKKPVNYVATIKYRYMAEIIDLLSHRSNFRARLVWKPDGLSPSPFYPYLELTVYGRKHYVVLRDHN